MCCCLENSPCWESFFWLPSQAAAKILGQTMGHDQDSWLQTRQKLT